MRRAAIFAGIIAFGFSLVPGRSQPAEAPPAQVPRFPYTATGDDHMKEAIRWHLATRPPWPIFARTAAAQQQPVVFDVTTERVVKPSSMGSPPRGYAQVVLKVKLGDRSPFEISAFAETPYVVPVAAASKLTAYEIGFRQAETEALNKVVPYVCARLIRLSGDADQIQALLQMIERRWPEEIALQLLRGLGPAANSWSDRLAGLVESQVTERQAPENVLTVLLAVDDRRGSEVLASLAEKLGDQGVPIVCQHLGLVRTVENVRNLSTFPPFPTPTPGELSPAVAESMVQWVRRCPAVAVVCANTLLEFDDARATATLKTLQELAPEIVELVTERERFKAERKEYAEKERERAEEAKKDREFYEEEEKKQKEKSGGN